MKLFLASNSIYCLENIESLLDKPFSETHVIFVPTASVPSQDRSYMQADLDNWHRLWFLVEVVCFDQIGCIDEYILEKLEQADIIYFSWWNTFFLLDRIKKVWFDKIASRLLKDWTILAWSSAWAVIMWPNVYPAHHVDDQTVVNNTNFSWLDIIDNFIIPHADLPVLQDKLDLIKKECEILWIKYTILKENEYIIIDNFAKRI